jgi:hypothetical protein
MSLKVFDLDEKENPQQYNFFLSRNDINGYTGGYGNGKTAAMCIRAITVAANYEGARCLVGRATRPKLEDSTKKELLKWIPEDWVEKWPSERHNDLILKKTGSAIEFRHVRQEGKGKNEEQSNLLSATYDYVGIDQFDDPEFTYKDFEDLNGRLRGTARYVGDDPTFPKYGPQWLDFTANPTRNWLYRHVVAPYFIYEKKGFITSNLLYDREQKRCIVNVFNAPTRANNRNTGGGAYTRRMNIVFRGSMQKRFVEGNWDAYEGLIYPDFHETTHVILASELQKHIAMAIINGAVGVIEGYDYGQASPACYLLGFVDKNHNVMIVDGFYEAGKSIEWQASEMKRIRAKWRVIPIEPIFADPDVFRSKHATGKEVGKSVSALFSDYDIILQKGANAINAGIQRVTSYIAVDKLHRHPISGDIGAPRFYVSSDLEFVHNEFADYYWNRNTVGQNVDKPLDRNDHSMDTIKYMFTKQAEVIGMLRPEARAGLNPLLLQFNELPDQDNDAVKPRYANG